jgi:hypothetical protein
MIIKPIETRYQGYRFRSRKEARFAVCFTALDLMWEYEYEGFQLDGFRYLPDFLLRDEQMWVEVKGKRPTEEEFEKATMLAQHDKKRMVVITWESFDERSSVNNICIWHDDNGVLHSAGGCHWLRHPHRGWRAARGARFDSYDRCTLPLPVPWAELGERGHGELPY